MTLLRKPVSIVLIGLYYLFSPVLNLLQIAWFTGLPLTGPVTLWSALGLTDWLVLASFPVVGLGMLTVRRWGWVVFVAFSVFLIGYNSFSFFVNRVYDIGLVLLYNLGLVAVTFIFFRKHLRAPYFNPRLRWWNVDPRYPVVLSARIGGGDSACSAEVLDLSQSGIFLSTCGEVEVGDTLEVSVDAFGKTLRCRGKVMRKSPREAAQPGFGLMFEDMDPPDKAVLKGLIGRLVAEGARERGLPAEAPTARDPLLKHAAWQVKRLVRELTGA